MKIIGKIDSDRFIVEATAHELAQVAGVSSAYQLEREAPEGVRALGVGIEVPVSPWWNFVQKLKRDEDSIRNMGATLRSIADLVTGAWPGIIAPTSDKAGE